MTVLDWASVALIVLGAVFFTGGTLAMLRFPDVLCRLHAPAKADNIGLGLLAIGLALQAESLAVAAKLVLIWVLAMFVGAGASYLVGRNVLRRTLMHRWESDRRGKSG